MLATATASTTAAAMPMPMPMPTVHCSPSLWADAWGESSNPFSCRRWNGSRSTNKRLLAPRMGMQVHRRRRRRCCGNSCNTEARCGTGDWRPPCCGTESRTGSGLPATSSARSKCCWERTRETEQRRRRWQTKTRIQHRRRLPFTKPSRCRWFRVPLRRPRRGRLGIPLTSSRPASRPPHTRCRVSTRRAGIWSGKPTGACFGDCTADSD
mmetsp:Transcript_3604/g.7943  ORF Transcript_3604/g.7943 Transcript_3604/m.7943 type:complete len:210 (-) Transcript_3604:171-800(-)